MQTSGSYTGDILFAETWSGCFMTDVEKVMVVALALQTTNASAIKDLIGLKKKQIKRIVEQLEANNWDPVEALENIQQDHVHNAHINQDTYPVLALKGAAE